MKLSQMVELIKEAQSLTYQGQQRQNIIDAIELFPQIAGDLDCIDWDRVNNYVGFDYTSLCLEYEDHLDYLNESSYLEVKTMWTTHTFGKGSSSYVVHLSSELPEEVQDWLYASGKIHEETVTNKSVMCTL